MEKDFLSSLSQTICTKNIREELPHKTYTPSFLTCVRGAFFKRIGVIPNTKKRTASFYRICDSGTDAHSRIQSYISDMKNLGYGWEYVSVKDYLKDRGITSLTITGSQGIETRLYHPQLHISFGCDGILQHGDDYFILEIKTETSNKWQFRKGIEPKHIVQVGAYSSLLFIQNVMFLYECRDFCEFKVFLHNVTHDERQEFISKILLSENCVSNETIPDKPMECSDKFCEYCEYGNSCKLCDAGVFDVHPYIQVLKEESHE